MARARFRIAVTVAVSAVALLAGCSDSAEGEPSADPSGSPSATTDAGVVTWADGVCSATTDFEAAMQGLTAALQVDPAASDTALDQAKAEVGERVGAVRGAADDLRAAINTSPPGVVSEAVASAQGDLSTAADQARTAADQLAAKGAAIADAGTPQETAAALTAAKEALATASQGAQAYVASLRQAAGSREPVLRDAFASAPACQARPSS